MTYEMLTFDGCKLLKKLDTARESHGMSAMTAFSFVLSTDLITVILKPAAAAIPADCPEAVRW